MEIQTKDPMNRWTIKKILTTLIILVLIGAFIVIVYFVSHTTNTDTVSKSDRREQKIEERRTSVSKKDTPTDTTSTVIDTSDDSTPSTNPVSTTETSDTTPTSPATTGNSNTVSKNESYSVTKYSGIVYGTESGVTLTMDIYVPKGMTGTIPAVLFVHGGGFHGGSANGVADESEMLAKHGVVVAAVNYRLSTTAIFPAQVYDVKGAIRYLKAHATTYQIDPNNVFALGESAGGVLASLLGVTIDNTSLEGTTGGNTGYSSSVKGVINISGSYVASIVDTMSNGILGAIEKEVGCSPVPGATCKSAYEALSPETYLSSGDVPYILLHGDQDKSVPVIQATTLNTKMKNAGITSEVHIAEGFGHVAGILNHNMSEVVDFLNRNS